MLRLQGRRCVVVGAGPVGMRKVRGLVEAGAETVLVAPGLTAGNGPAGVEVIPHLFVEEDIIGAALVFAATDDPATNRLIAAAARRCRIPVNIVDDPEASDFVLPASFAAGDLVVSVATRGVSPAVAVMVRDDIEKSLPVEWPTFLKIAGILRSRLLTSSSKATYNQQVLRNLVSHGILIMIADTDAAGIDRLLESEFGKGYSLADLGISLSKGSS